MTTDTKVQVGAEIKMPVRVRAVLDRSGFTSNEKHVLLVMVLYGNADGTRICPGIPRIARECGLSVNTVRAAIQSLCKKQVLELTHEATQRYANTYRLRFDALEKLPSSNEEPATLPAEEAERRRDRALRFEVVRTPDHNTENPRPPTRGGLENARAPTHGVLGEDQEEPRPPKEHAQTSKTPPLGLHGMDPTGITGSPVIPGGPPLSGPALAGCPNGADPKQFAIWERRCGWTPTELKVILTQARDLDTAGYSLNLMLEYLLDTVRHPKHEGYRWWPIREDRFLKVPKAKSKRKTPAREEKVPVARVKTAEDYKKDWPS